MGYTHNASTASTLHQGRRQSQVDQDCANMSEEEASSKQEPWELPWNLWETDLTALPNFYILSIRACTSKWCVLNSILLGEKKAVQP